MKWHKLTLRKMNDEEKKKYQGCEAYYEGDVPEYSLDFSVKYIVAKKYNDNFRIIIDNFIFESYMSLPEFEDTDIDEDETIYWCEIPEFDFLGGLNMNDDPIKPKHYQLGDGVEVMDIIREITKPISKIRAFWLGNVVKYIFRAENKNGLEDYKKAREYLNLLVEDAKKDNFLKQILFFMKNDLLKKTKKNKIDLMKYYDFKFMPLDYAYEMLIEYEYEASLYFLDEHIMCLEYSEKEKENEK